MMMMMMLIMLVMVIIMMLFGNDGDGDGAECDLCDSGVRADVAVYYFGGDGDYGGDGHDD